MGYRAKNLLATAKRVASGEADLHSWSALSDDKLREQLCELPGVGMKVANCVMLFAYQRIAAFPIDVWIERVLREKYFVRRRKVTSQVMAEFAANYFGAYGGYAQQYLFHHARMTGKRPEKEQARDLCG
jgi:N-glycosylase/DNA lyase